MASIILNVETKTDYPDINTIDATEAAIIRIQDLTRNPLAVHTGPEGWTIETPEELAPKIRSILERTNLRIIEN